MAKHIKIGQPVNLAESWAFFIGHELPTTLNYGMKIST